MNKTYWIRRKGRLLLMESEMAIIEGITELIAVGREAVIAIAGTERRIGNGGS